MYNITNLNLYPVTGVKLDLTITPLFIEKIRNIHSITKTDEWGGLCFYNIKGELTDTKINLELIDLVPLAIGSKASFSMDYENPIIIDYQMKYLGCKQGLIHSHNIMEVFISGTDESEIITQLKQGYYPEYYLSVVVNVFGDLLVSLTKKIEILEQIKFTINNKTKTINKKVESYITLNKTFNYDNNNGEIISEMEELVKIKKAKDLIIKTKTKSWKQKTNKNYPISNDEFLEETYYKHLINK